MDLLGTLFQYVFVTGLIIFSLLFLAFLYKMYKECDPNKPDMIFEFKFHDPDEDEDDNS